MRRAASRAGGIGILAVLLVISLIELALADRKFGLFTGGFGQSRAVDTSAELMAFLAGYGAAQALAAMIAWWLIVRLNRSRSGWAHLFHFACGFGGAFILALALRYQLHSYFSDAVNFALIKQLGGGSLGDALLFGMNEIALGMGALLAGIGLYWLAWRWVLRRAPRAEGAAHGPSRAALGLSALALLAALAVIPRSGGDAPYGLNRTLVWSTLNGVLDAATDFDRDGYGLFAIARDARPFDAAQHPLALDVPGNGVDEDGFGGDLKLAAVPAQPPATQLPKGSPNLIIVIMESTRADALGKVVHGKPVTPALDALAAQGSFARPAFSHVAFTTASLKSIFAGALDPVPGNPSLFTDLKASGYRIGVFSGQPEDFGDISATVGMRDAADVFVDAESLKDKRAFGFAAQGSLLVDEKFLLEAFDRDFGKPEAWQQPNFLYFNFQSPHFPYSHDGLVSRITDTPIPRGRISAENREWLARTYYNAVSASDYWLGELVVRLKRLGVWDNTVLVVSGDHGEDLFEDGLLGHGHVISARQYATFLVANRKGIAPAGAIGLSDYRGLLLEALAGKAGTAPQAPPFLQIGPLDTPTAIGLPEADGSITTLRLDTREACLGQPQACHSYDSLRGKAREQVDRLITRWGSERWARRQVQALRR